MQTPKKNFKKIFIYFFMAAAVATLVVMVSVMVPAFFYRPETNANPLPPGYVKGVYHIHSVFSDGAGTVDEIAGATAALGLDFAILTDHGLPNTGSAAATAWKNGVLLVGGSELSLHAGHLAAVGFEPPDHMFPPEPRNAVEEVIHRGGVCFVAHPFDDKVPWTDWHGYRYNGIELLSAYTAARRAGILNLLLFPARYLANPTYALVKSLQYPQQNIEKWDALNGDGSGQRYHGIHALDIHARLPIGKSISLRFPTYKSAFGILTLYVKIPRPLDRDDPLRAASTITSALRRGDFFNVIEGIAPANGFGAFFIAHHSEQNSGHNAGRPIPMGGVSTARRGRLVLRLPFDFKTRIRVYRNGARYRQMDWGPAVSPGGQVEIEIGEPGVYRAEVLVPGNSFHRLPWIMTNPFFLGVRGETASPLPPATPGNAEAVPRRPLPGTGEAFGVESNGESRGTLRVRDGVTEFRFSLVKGGGRDFWSAAALRGNYDLSTYQGFVLRVRSDRRRYVWLEFRTGEGDREVWYRHSVLADSRWRTHRVPFDRFYRIVGNAANDGNEDHDGNNGQRLNLTDVRSIFVALNNANAYAGTTGVLHWQNLGLY